MKDVHTYNEKIEYKKGTKRIKKKYNFFDLFIWYIGVVVSFFPIFLDVLICLPSNVVLTRYYWVKMCTNGDVLWILATLILLSSINYFCDGRQKRRDFRLGFAIIGLALWGFSFATWVVFKYLYPANYDGVFPIILVCIMGVVALVCATPLQLKAEKEEIL